MILERLKEKAVLGDGGAVFELERRGYMSAGPFVPEVAIQHPEALRQLQVDFARAGAQVLQALTYYAHEEKLRQLDMAWALEDINVAAVTIAREVADAYGCLVAGNLSNTWVYDPRDPSSHRKTREQFDRQLLYQLPHGVDFVIAETLEYLGEAKIALEAIKATGKPSMITLGFKSTDRTLEGVLLEEAFKELEDAGADILGTNCFRDPPRMMPLAKRIRETVSCFVATQPVAYRCTDERPFFQIQEIEGRPAFPLELDPFVLTRFEMAEYALEAQRSAINYIGGCCGTAPHHLRAMAEALGRAVPNSRYSPRMKLHPDNILKQTGGVQNASGDAQ
ncbi:MAG: homocysteine S-methyltransferase family protein [Deltaproteobacteria bacterium]|nr:homocysteine S-methyltransferase family protein [Deltaproteobacteria bacterium]